MLPVSNDWKALFNQRLLPQAILIVDINGFHSFDGKKIFSYNFVGKVDPLSLSYPSYEATIVFDNSKGTFNNPNQYLNQYTEISYGFMVNGTAENHIALVMYCYDYQISDDGLRATLMFRSYLANFTQTIGEHQYKSFNGSYWSYIGNKSILQDELDDVYPQYVIDLPYTWHDFNVKALPNNITSGEYFQTSALLHRVFFYVSGEEVYFKKKTDSIVFNDLNLIEFPHIEPPKYTSVNVICPTYNSEENSTTEVGYGYESSTHISGTNYSMRNLTINLTENNGFIDDNSIEITPRNFTNGTNSFVFTNKWVEVSFSTATGVGSASNVDVSVCRYNKAPTTPTTNQLAIYSPMIYNNQHANYIRDFAKRYAVNSQEVSMKLRFDPAIELFDTIIIDNRTLLITEINLQFDGAFTATIKGKEYMIEDPDLIDYDIQYQDWWFDIGNTNNKAMTLRISYSDGYTDVVINANNIKEINENNTPSLYDYVRDYLDHELNEDVVCYFIDDEGSQISETIIMLEANR